MDKPVAAIERHSLMMEATRNARDVDRFWSYVIKSESCWLWTGTKGRERARFSICRNNKVTMVNASRFSWAIHNGDFPRELFLCHKCDNQLCVNPAHLFLGTPLDNMRDRDLKGRNRQPKGERVHGARLTEEAVMKIRATCHDLAKQAQFASEYGVATATVNDAYTFRTWRHVKHAVARNVELED